jgi:hypothetical protein
MAELSIPAGVGEDNAVTGLAKAQDDLDQILQSASRAPEPQAEPPLPEEVEPAPPEPAQPEEPTSFPQNMLDAAAYAVSPQGISAGLSNIAEVPSAAARGALKGVDAVIGIGDMLQEAMPVPGMQLFDMDGNFDPKFVGPEEIATDTKTRNEQGYAFTPNPIDAPKTPTGNLAQGAAQFLAGFGLAGRALTAASAGAKGIPFWMRASGQGMFSDFAAFDGHEERLSNWLAQEGNPELVRTVGAFLAAEQDDTELQGRLKNVIEGAGLDIAFGGILAGLKSIKQARRVKADLEASNYTAAAKKLEAEALASGKAPSSGKDPFASIGSSDPDAPLIIKPQTARPAPGQAPKAPPASALTGAKRVALDEGEVFINFARINTGEDVQSVIRQMAEASSDSIGKAQRGVVPNKVTEKAADAKYGEAFEAILSRRTGEGVPPQDVQLAMRRLWASSAEKLMESAKAFEASSTAENALAFRRMIVTHKLIQEQVLAVRTETARALQQWSIPAGAVAKDKIDAINQAISNGGGLDATVELARQFSAIADRVALDPRNMARLDNAVEMSAGARSLQAVQEVWKAVSLMSGVKTHLRNVISNTGMIMSAVSERAVAARLAGIIDEPTEVAIGEASRFATGVIHNIREAWSDATETFKTGNMKLGESQIETGNRALAIQQLNPKNPIGAAVLKLAAAPTSFVFRMLQGSDQFFKTLNYSGEVYAQAWRKAVKEGQGKMTMDQMRDRALELMTNPPRDIIDAATAQAAKATFTEDPGKITQALMNVREKVPVLHFLMPFLMTPGNILRTSMLSTPLAPLMTKYKEAIAQGGAEATLARTRMGIGTTVMLTTLDLAINDKLSGSGPDPQSSEYKTLIRTGWRPYSVKVGDKWVSYRGLEPFTTVIGMGADIGEAVKKASNSTGDSLVDTGTMIFDMMSAATFGVAQGMLERSYLTGMADFIDAARQSETKGPVWFEKFIASFTPRILLDARQITDPAIYDARTLVENIKQRIPGMQDDLTQRRDEWGRALKIDSGLGRAYDILSPLAVTQSKPEAIDKELLEQGISLGIRNREMSVNGVRINIGNRADIHNRFLELRGNTKPSQFGAAGQRLVARYGDLTLLETLNAVVGGDHKLSARYQKGSDGQDGDKHALLRSILADYSKAATTNTLKEFPDLLTAAKQKRAQRINRADRGEELFPSTLGQ